MSPITKIIELLTPRELKKGAYILFLVTIMALLETLGIASIMPFLAVLGDPSLIQNNWIIIKLFMFSSYLFVNTEDQFLLFLGLCSFS